MDAGWANRLAHEQTDNSEFATSVRPFDEVIQEQPEQL